MALKYKKNCGENKNTDEPAFLNHRAKKSNKEGKICLLQLMLWSLKYKKKNSYHVAILPESEHSLQEDRKNCLQPAKQ